VNAVLLYAAGKINSADFLCLKKDRGEMVLIHKPIDLIDPANAGNIINDLLAYFACGVKAPLKFTPRAAINVKKAAKVENIFVSDANGDEFASIPSNDCIKNLYLAEYFKEFDIENFTENRFDPKVYDEPRFDEIKRIAALLNLSKV
jgi:hypothetical protein